jgi:thymidylate synthase
MYQRSADMFLGVPFNIASYSLLMHILGKVLDLTPRHFIHSFGDAHIYLNSVDQVQEQIKRTPRELPQLKFPDINNLEDLKDLSLDDFVLEGYDPHPAIKAKMAI